MSLITLPIVPTEQDEKLMELVAGFLTRHGFVDQSALPHALRLLAALEQYNQDADLEKCARCLGSATDSRKRRRL